MANDNDNEIVLIISNDLKAIMTNEEKIVMTMKIMKSNILEKYILLLIRSNEETTILI